ncbi:MAG: fused MFS/spermidine synthase [Myxococcota bacterium]
MRVDDRVPLRVALGWFCAVGAGALIVETTWMRWLRDLMGATAPAVSVALVSVALGQLLGALLGGRIAARARDPASAFAFMIIAAAASSAWVEPWLNITASFADVVGPLSGPSLLVARLAAALLATLPASTAIGACFPILIAASSARASELGANGSSIYAADLLGAAFGAAVTAFWLPSMLGVRGAYFVGVGLFVIVAVFGAARVRRASKGAALPTAKRVSFHWPPLWVGLVSATSGFGIFAAEILLHQAFGRVLDQSTFALGAVLTTTLVSLAIGALAVARLHRRVDPTTLLIASSGASAMAFALFPRAFDAASDGLSLVVSSPGRYVPSAIFLCALTSGPALVAAAMLLPTLFVVAGRDAVGDGRDAGHLAGGIMAANTGGAVAGALAGPYLLLPKLDLWPSFLALAVAYALVAMVVARHRRYAWAWSIVLAAALVLATPWRTPALRLAPGDELLHAETSAQGLVAVIGRGGERFVQTDNHYVLGGTPDAIHQERQGHLPLLLHPNPKRVAFLGSATGSSAGAALSHDVEELVTVEIMPGVVEAAREFFGDHNAGVYEAARTIIVHDDVRRFMRRDAPKFDVIVGDLFVPWRAETGALYTVEQFERTRRRLAPGGIFCQWLPLYQLSARELDSVMATFLDVFPDAQVYRGDFYGRYGIAALCGHADGTAHATEGVAGRAGALRRQGVEDRWVTHPLGVPALYVGPLAALGHRLESTPRNTLDQPYVEFSAAGNPARHAGAGDWAVAGDAFVDRVATLRSGSEPKLWASPEEARASAGGAALQAASTHWTLDRSDAAADALTEAAALLAPELLSEAPPDPTAADVWHVTPAP